MDVMNQLKSVDATRILWGGEALATLITMDRGPQLLHQIGWHSLAEAVEERRRRGTSARQNMTIVEKQE